MKTRNVVVAFIILAGTATVLSSCKDDEEPRSTIGFDTDMIEVNEADGNVGITLTFDRPLSENVTLKFALSGTADEGDDYDVPDGKSFTVTKGATEAEISLDVYEDLDFELEDEETFFETIILTLTEVQGNGQLGTDKVFTVYVYEDDLIVFLDWEREEEDDVDMDILVWTTNPTNGEYVTVFGSVSEGNDVEAVNIPAGFIDAEFGLGYPYYEGSDEEVNFRVDFINFGGLLNGSDEDLSFFGTYTENNINRWVDVDETKVVQYTTKTNSNYTEFTEIEVPESGSRKPTMSGKDYVRNGKLKSAKLAPRELNIVRKMLKK